MLKIFTNCCTIVTVVLSDFWILGCFATCSDDSTVSLWDSRFTIRSVMTLNGHSSWVKNIEYAQSEGLLLTSGFDGSIFTWDINANRSDLIYQLYWFCGLARFLGPYASKYQISTAKYGINEYIQCCIWTCNFYLIKKCIYLLAFFRSEKSVRGNCIFHMEGLMRSKLTSDNKKLIMSTSNGLIIIIHDLDLDTMQQDIKNLQPQDYWFRGRGNLEVPMWQLDLHEET